MGTQTCAEFHPDQKYVGPNVNYNLTTSITQSPENQTKTISSRLLADGLHIQLATANTVLA